MLLLAFVARAATAQDRPPHILFAIADDWGWPHAGSYADPVVKTPTFDRIAREGIPFHHAYISSPSCTPSRAAILTGQYHWRLEESANLWSTLQAKFPVYPDLLEDAGYSVGYTRKGWGARKARTGRTGSQPRRRPLRGLRHIPRRASCGSSVQFLVWKFRSASRLRERLRGSERYGPRRHRSRGAFSR